MVDVNERNFRKWLPEIENCIKNAAFIAVDLEFLGLPSSSHPKAVSLFDTPAERYVKLCDAVRRFPPCQLGLACFQETEDGYEVEVFCIALFKRLCKRVYSFSLGAMSFLAQHNFDFNKFVSEGITYSNKPEVAKLKKDILSGEVDYDIFTDGLEHRLQMLKVRILMEAQDSDSDDARKDCVLAEDIRLDQPLLLELCAKETDPDDDDFDFGGPAGDNSEREGLWEKPVTSVEAAIIVYVLSDTYPQFEFQVDPTRTLLYVAEIPHIFRSMKEKKKNKSALKALLAEISGVSQIFTMLSEKKSLLVGHNSLLDLMYIYYCFEAELPDSYEKWKKAIMSAFPMIVDTKVLASSLQETLRHHGVMDFSLQTLVDYFDSPSCGHILPFQTPKVISGRHTGTIFNDSEHFHNAAFDSLVTGEIFIKLANLYATKKCSPTQTEPWPLQKMLIVLRKGICNRIPIPLIDMQHCYLGGEDPVGERPDIIRLRLRRRIDWFYQMTESEKWERVIGHTLDYCLGYKKFSDEETSRIRDDLVRALGSFRVEVRRDERKDILLIATNTSSSFARVCSFFVSHDDFCLVDEVYNGISFEQRLTSSRRLKDSTKSRQSSFYRLFPIFCGTLAVFCVFKMRKSIFSKLRPSHFIF